MSAVQASPAVAGTETEPLVLVSIDSHFGPIMETQLRPYCPAGHLEAFDAFVAGFRAAGGVNFAGNLSAEGDATTVVGRIERNAKTAGHHDVAARIHDMDRDGVAAEVIFHGSQNDEMIPFAMTGLVFEATGDDLDLKALGFHIYNQWLADAVAEAPDRLIGCAHIPVWDIEESIAELEWARAAGLQSVNFSVPRPGVLEYDNPAWEPFWSACEDLDMTLSTHAGAGTDPWSFVGPQRFSLNELENGGWLSRRAIHRMVFGGVFERHPRLKLVLTEQPGDWWSYSMREMDSTWKTFLWAHGRQIPRPPSEYCATNVFIGDSMTAPFEAQAAVRDGYVANLMWGRDYPHQEGTWLYPADDEEEPLTQLSLRHAFAGIAPDHVRRMVGMNAVDVYGLDAERLAAIAARIGAPTLTDLARPLDAIPEVHGMLAFRTLGPWG